MLLNSILKIDLEDPSANGYESFQNYLNQILNDKTKLRK